MMHFRFSYGNEQSQIPVDLDIDLQIERNEIVGIFGESGIGKTTLLRIISGFVRPSKGEIVSGDVVWSSTIQSLYLPPQKRSIAMLFQDGALFPEMSVLENIRFARNKKSDAVEEQLLRDFGLLNIALKKAKQLSGGQQQRLALARTLAQEAGLYLLDEPFTALDRDARDQLENTTLQILRRSAQNAIVVSHELPLLERMCDRIFRLVNGKLIEFDKSILQPQILDWEASENELKVEISWRGETYQVTTQKDPS